VVKGRGMRNSQNQKQLMLIKSEDNSCLIELAMRFHNQYSGENLLFLSHKEVSFVQDSIKELKGNMPEFDSAYEQVRFMFLKQSWDVLYKMYGKTFFINEIQKMIKEEQFSTLYFHRADTFFEGCSKRDIDRIVSDIVEIAKYYHKMVIFSLGERTRLGEIMDEVLYKEIDLEYFIKRDKDGGCQSTVTKYKKEDANIILFSDKDESVKFHKYIFKKDEHIHFQHVQKLDDTNQALLEEADIIIFNLHNIPLKDKILNFIKQRNLKTKFLFLSDDKMIRKRDKVLKIEKGIFQVFEKDFNLLEYIDTIEKIIGRDFYTTVLNKVNIFSRNRYFTENEILKNSVYKLLNYHIYFSMVAVEYKNDDIKQETIENCIRELDSVYHNKDAKNLVFLLVDTLPHRGLSLISQRLEDRGVEVTSKQVFDVNACLLMISDERKNQMKEVV